MNKKEIYIKLEKAVGDNNVQEVSNILDQHSDLDLNDENLYTLHPPLCRAAKKGFYEICKTLIQYGADVNCIKDRLFSPLWGASSGNHLEIVKLLIENGADINAYESSTTSALNEAAAKGHFEIVRYLIQKGADINRLTTTLLYSPLDWSIAYERNEISVFLKEHGALSNIGHDYVWLETGGGISQHIDWNIGRVIPNKFNEMDSGVFNRLAVVNRGNNSLLFSVGNFQYTQPYVEFVIVLPFGWNPYSKMEKTQFPYMIMNELTNQVRNGRTFSDGDFISKTENGFSTIPWPKKLAGFYVVDYIYSATEEQYSNKEDIVTLYTLIPAKATQKGYSEQSLDKLKSKKWKAIELSL
ncbi:ankyrin repeat domain-containing protein [Bacteroides acidifaciens]|uniref:ankyrin repeat domain-containing protein n=1 Tax=Bacteroides acidifaciens TaxID=85831 RepID=UPI00255800D0|nr:ankyrin repeat domain-containing protein [Bacteroides acidifaciens]